MALFGRKNEEQTKKASPAAVAAGTPSGRDLSRVLETPRITEKAALLSEQGTYVFVVRRGATKYEVRDAVASLYGVTPTKVRIVNRPARRTRSRMRGRTTTQPALRKAYVTLKDGDRIELV